MMLSRQRLVALLSLGLSLAFLVPIASAVRYNVTIDDTYGDPTNNEQISYSPLEAWKLGQRCTDCTAEPDAARAYNGTWHDGSANDPATPLDAATLMANVPFIGEAVYVYCILTGSTRSPDGYSFLRFYLDGNQVGEFIHDPDGDSTYQYNVPVYVNHSVPFAGHLLQIVNGAIGGKQSLILLDYVVYTFDTEATVQPGESSSAHTLPPVTVSAVTSMVPVSSSAPPTPSSLPSSLPTVVGQNSSSVGQSGLSRGYLALIITIGGGLVVAFVIGSAVAYWRKRKRSRVAPSTEYLRSVAASRGAQAGAVADAESPASPTSRWVSAGDVPPAPASFAPFEPDRPGSTRSEVPDTDSQGPFGDDNEAEIHEVPRT